MTAPNPKRNVLNDGAVLIGSAFLKVTVDVGDGAAVVAEASTAPELTNGVVNDASGSFTIVTAEGADADATVEFIGDPVVKELVVIADAAVEPPKNDSNVGDEGVSVFVVIFDPPNEKPADGWREGAEVLLGLEPDVVASSPVMALTPRVVGWGPTPARLVARTKVAIIWMALVVAVRLPLLGDGGGYNYNRKSYSGPALI